MESKKLNLYRGKKNGRPLTASSSWFIVILFWGKARLNENPMIKVIFTEDGAPATEEIHFSSGTGNRQRLVIRFPWFLHRVCHPTISSINRFTVPRQKKPLNLLDSLRKFFVTVLWKIKWDNRKKLYLQREEVIFILFFWMSFFIWKSSIHWEEYYIHNFL